VEFTEFHFTENVITFHTFKRRITVRRDLYIYTHINGNI